MVEWYIEPFRSAEVFFGCNELTREDNLNQMIWRLRVESSKNPLFLVCIQHADILVFPSTFIKRLGVCRSSNTTHLFPSVYEDQKRHIDLQISPLLPACLSTSLFSLYVTKGGFDDRRSCSACSTVWVLVDIYNCFENQTNKVLVQLLMCFALMWFLPCWKLAFG